MKLLEVVKITKRFGGLTALNDISFEVEKGEILGIIGPNGAGKTTLFNIINGIYPPSSGKIIFQGRDITNLPPHKIARMGIGRTFQLVRPFLTMTVLENVMCGALFANQKIKGGSDAHSKSLHVLDMFGLLNKKDTIVENLTLIDRKMVELATALAGDPNLLLADEPMAGLRSAEIDHLLQLFSRIRDEFGITIVWIEHVMRAVMRGADRIIVLNFGKKIAEGKPSEIASDPKVIEAYLGRPYIGGE